MTAATPLQILGRFCTNPTEYLLRRWNWKQAVFSSVFRALIFFFANLRAGWRAATGAMLLEFAYRAVTCGFYGAITQSFREAKPRWAGMLTACIVVPLSTHSLEFLVHYAHGTPKLKASIISSVTFTMLSTLFTLYCMERSAFVVGVSDERSLAHDCKQIPRLLGGFLWFGPKWLIERARVSIELSTRWLAGAFSFQKSDAAPPN
jgi:hypothetical protein